jgi:hypothetical protein
MAQFRDTEEKSGISFYEIKKAGKETYRKLNIFLLNKKPETKKCLSK